MNLYQKAGMKVERLNLTNYSAEPELGAWAGLLNHG